MRRLRLLLLAPVVALLSACDLVVLKPAGDVAAQQGGLLMISTLLMLLIIVPVMALIVFFAWKYRASNKDADYRPDWDHSTSLELVIWAVPLLIILQTILGAAGKPDIAGFLFEHGTLVRQPRGRFRRGEKSEASVVDSPATVA